MQATPSSTINKSPDAEITPPQEEAFPLEAPRRKSTTGTKMRRLSLRCEENYADFFEDATSPKKDDVVSVPAAPSSSSARARRKLDMSAHQTGLRKRRMDTELEGMVEEGSNFDPQ